MALLIPAVRNQRASSFPTQSAIAIGGHTVFEGTLEVIIFKTPTSCGPSGLVVGTTTIPLSDSYPNPIILVLGGNTFTAGLTEIAILGATLARDASASLIAGTWYSVYLTGHVTGSSTYQLPFSLPDLLTAAGTIFTVDAKGHHR